MTGGASRGEPIATTGGGGEQLPSAEAVRQRFDPELARADFPALAQSVHGRPLAYLDNAATTQMPSVVIDAVAAFDRSDRANVHRGVHTLSERATAAYEGARATVQRFLNAREAREIIFVRGATEAINLVAQSFGRAEVGPGDEVLVTALEHHSNLVPWQMLCAERQARLRVVPVTPAGELKIDDVEAAFGPRTRIFAVAHVANAIGTVNPIGALIERARARGVPVLVDGAQAAAHLPIDVQALGCDFYAFSAHKMYGPTGIGVLYGRAERLEHMAPFMGGGEMVRSVSLSEGPSWAALPHKFEAGTPNLEGAVGLGAAIAYLERWDRAAIAAHERALATDAAARIAAIPGARIVGQARERAAIVSFVLDRVHPHDIGTILDRHGVAIRAGHHCAQPLLDSLGVAATARASFALYNTRRDVDALIDALGAVRKVFG
jgi:cysteine desulfurase / selenocysteine lyase